MINFSVPYDTSKRLDPRLPTATVAEPPSVDGVLVITLITPPNASAPYNVEAAPFTTSIRFMALVGIEPSPPLPLRFIGTPFTRTRAPRSRPRIFVRLSMPPKSAPPAP